LYFFRLAFWIRNPLSTDYIRREHWKPHFENSGGTEEWRVSFRSFGIGVLTLLLQKKDVFQDVSLSQWLALTPPELVKAHLGFSDEVIQHLAKVKQTLVPSKEGK